MMRTHGSHQRKRFTRSGLALMGMALALNGTVAAPVRAAGTVSVPKSEVKEPLYHAQPGGYGASVAIGDFDGDGIRDVAVGDPGFDTTVYGRSVLNTGRVTVWYGQRGGGFRWHQIFDLRAETDYFWSTDYRYGQSLAAGDFNRDGLADLAVGIPGDHLYGESEHVWTPGAGSVEILHGSRSGLQLVQRWSQDAMGQDRSENDDSFGYSLAVGDFDANGVDDLAIGVPNEDVGSVVNAGAVNVLYGTPTRYVRIGYRYLLYRGQLSSSGSQTWHQDSAYIPGKAEASDHFGWALAAGNFGVDAADDLAVGTPYETLDGSVWGGLVLVLYGEGDGTKRGLQGTGSHNVHQNNSGVPGKTEFVDRFGYSLAVGNFDGRCQATEYDDLAVGVPGETLGSGSASKFHAGAVNVFYGTAAGIRSTMSQIWHQNSPGIEGGSEGGDNFGFSLAAGDFNDDCSDDLGIGVPGEDIGSIKGAGAVNVIYGSSSGLREQSDRIWHRGSAYIHGHPEFSDSFGWALGAGELDGYTGADLVVGVPFDTVSGVNGAFNTLYGSRSGLSASANRLTFRPY